MCQLHPFLIGRSAHCHPCFLIWITAMGATWAAFEELLEVSTGAEYNGTSSKCIIHNTQVRPLLLELLWLLVYFWMQSKVLVVTFRALHGSGLGYLRDWLSLSNSIYPIWSSMLQIPSARVSASGKQKIKEPKRREEGLMCCNPCLYCRVQEVGVLLVLLIFCKEFKNLTVSPNLDF